MTNRIRIRRAELRISQLDTALEAGISPGRLWKLENGYARPTDEERSSIATVLNTDSAALWPTAQPMEAAW